MLKNHRFLRRMIDSLSNMFSVKIGKYKNATMVVAYVVAATLLVINPYSMGNSHTNIARAQTILGAHIEEETDNAAAIIQTNNTDNILSETEGMTLLQMQQNNASYQQDKDIADKEIAEENIIVVDKEAEKKIAEYIKVTEAYEMAEHEAKRQEMRETAPARLKAAAERKVAEEKAEAERVEAERVEAERIAAEKAEAERIAAVEKAEAEKAEVERKAEAEKAAAKKTAAEKKAKAQKASSTSSRKIGNHSAKDIEILYRIVEAEATGEDLRGKLLVANVVLNRVNSKKFPGSIEGVVFQKGQFSPIRDGRYYSVSITSGTKEAVNRALEGEDYSQGALYFAARKIANKKNMKWFDSHLTRLFEHGCHEFFK